VAASGTAWPCWPCAVQGMLAAATAATKASAGPGSMLLATSACYKAPSLSQHANTPHHLDKCLTGSTLCCTLQANWRQTALSLLHQAAQAAACTAAGACHPGHISSSGSAGSATRLQQLEQHLAAAVAAAGKPPPAVPGFTSDFLYRRWCRSHACLSGFLPPADQVPRVDQSTLNPLLFLERYDMPAQPVILTGFMDAEWPAGGTSNKTHTLPAVQSKSSARVHA
jgi:hypothetical protein